MNLKAKAVLKINERLKPGEKVNWVTYNGKDVIVADTIYNRLNGFFMSGDPMPITGIKNHLHIMSLERSFDDVTGRHQITVEAMVVDSKRKEKSPNE